MLKEVCPPYYRFKAQLNKFQLEFIGVLHGHLIMEYHNAINFPKVFLRNDGNSSDWQLWLLSFFFLYMAKLGKKSDVLDPLWVLRRKVQRQFSSVIFQFLGPYLLVHLMHELEKFRLKRNRGYMNCEEKIHSAGN